MLKVKTSLGLDASAWRYGGGKKKGKQIQVQKRREKLHVTRSA